VPLEAHPSRHDLVWLAPAWRGALRCALEPGRLAEAVAWIERGLPAVAARLGGVPGACAGLALGIALPGSEGRRLSLLVGPEAVARVAPPLTLREATASAPAGWRPRLAELDAGAAAAGLTLRVYGSLAWQHLAGRPYLTTRSDVDLLVRPRDAAELRASLALLRAHAARGAPPLDGEILLDGGRAVAWRELLAAPARVLVKSDAAVALEPISEALGALAGGS
jgi:phosphoribosyl-dephospho-CoA transferase